MSSATAPTLLIAIAPPKLTSVSKPVPKISTFPATDNSEIVLLFCATPNVKFALLQAVNCAFLETRTLRFLTSPLFCAIAPKFKVVVFAYPLKSTVSSEIVKLTFSIFPHFSEFSTFVKEAKIEMFWFIPLLLSLIW